MHVWSFQVSNHLTHIFILLDIPIIDYQMIQYLHITYNSITLRINNIYHMSSYGRCLNIISHWSPPQYDMRMKGWTFMLLYGWNLQCFTIFYYDPPSCVLTTCLTYCTLHVGLLTRQSNVYPPRLQVSHLLARIILCTHIVAFKIQSIDNKNINTEIKIDKFPQSPKGSSQLWLWLTCLPV